MKAAALTREISQWYHYVSERASGGWRKSPLLLKRDKVPQQGGTGVDFVLQLLVAFTFGLFSFWLSLVLLGLIGLNHSEGQLLTSFELRMVVAASFALIICIVAFPLFVPWLAVFVPVYRWASRNSILRKWWLCTLTGSLVGVVGLWIDALVYSLFPSGSSPLLNVPLLLTASIPAAVLGGATCFAATVLGQIAKRKNDQAGIDDQRATSSKPLEVPARCQGLNGQAGSLCTKRRLTLS